MRSEAGAELLGRKWGFASRMQIDDLRDVLGELGFDYRMPGPAGHWQAICPACKRKSVATAQLRLKGISS